MCCHCFNLLIPFFGCSKAFGKDNTIGGDAFDLSKQENIEKLGVEGSDSEDDEGEGGELTGVVFLV